MEITFNHLLFALITLTVILFYLSQLKNKSPLADNINKDKNSFIKPENKLYYLFHNISSGKKLTLRGKCNTNYYTENTLPVELKDYLRHLEQYTSLELIHQN